MRNHKRETFYLTTVLLSAQDRILNNAKKMSRKRTVSEHEEAEPVYRYAIFGKKECGVISVPV